MSIGLEDIFELRTVGKDIETVCYWNRVNESTLSNELKMRKAWVESELEVFRTDGSVEKTEYESKDDKSSVPVMSTGYGCYAQIHEDDCFCHWSRQLDDAFDRCLWLDGDVCFAHLA